MSTKAAIAAIVLLLTASAFAQEDTYNQAKREMILGHTDQAMQLYCSLAPSNYRDTRALCTMLRTQGAAGKNNYDALYSEAVKLFDAGHLDEAAELFQAVKGGSHFEDAKNYMLYRLPQARIKAEEQAQQKQQQQQEERAAASSAAKAGANRFEQAVAAYDHNDFAKARSLFSELSGPQGALGRTYLDKISQYERSMQQADSAAAGGNYAKAAEGYRLASSIKPSGPGDPQAKLSKVEKLAEQAKATGADKSAAAPADTASKTSSVDDKQPILSRGLSAYYDGRFSEAEADLNKYIGENGAKPALAQFYLGVCKLTRYYLTPKSTRQDTLMAEAKTAFQSAKKIQGFVPPEKYVSPRVMEVWAEVNP